MKNSFSKSNIVEHFSTAHCNKRERIASLNDASSTTNMSKVEADEGLQAW